MSRFSRREFLKRSGVLAGIAGIQLDSAAPPSDRLAGRALALADVHARPDSASPVLSQLSPDRVVPIDGISRDTHWYQIQDSFVRREALQPIQPYNRPDLVAEIGSGFWAEVAAPISPIREWCAAAAPILARPAFGAVVYAMDRIVDDFGRAWYGITDSPGSRLVGWATALHYAPWIRESTGTVPSPRIVIENGELVVFDGERIVGRAAMYGPRLPRTETVIRAIRPGAALDSHCGVPWLIELANGRRIHGAYWHNRFGSISDGSDFELGTFAARWLYHVVASVARPVPVIIV
jgi:hypothetical protein